MNSNGGILVRRRLRRRDVSERNVEEESLRDRGGTGSKKELEMLRGKKRRKREESTEEEDEDDQEEGLEASRRSRSRQSPVWKVTKEMIPRKVRSASVKRSSSNSGGGGSGEDLNSPSSSNVSAKDKMQSGSAELPAKGYNSVQEDIEIEIAEVLYGLMKQSRKQAEVPDHRDDEIGSEKKEVDDNRNELMDAEVDHVGAMEIPLEELKKDELSAVQSVDPDRVDGFASKEELKHEEEPAMNIVAPQVESKREEKLEIDLMAPPPLDADGDNVLDHKQMPNDTEMEIELLRKDEETGEQIIKIDCENKFRSGVCGDRIGEENSAEVGGSCKLNLKNYDSENSHVSGSQPPKIALPDVKKTAPSSLLSLQVSSPGWPRAFPSMRYVPPAQTMVSMDDSSGISATVQPPSFLLSQPPAKRCMTHQYIARNIFYHQQFTKRSQLSSAPCVSSSSFYEAKPNNLNAPQSTENFSLGNPLQGSFPGGNIIPTASNAAASHLHVGKEKACDVFTLAEKNQKKQHLLHQASQSVPAGKLMNGTAVMLPVSQHQPEVLVSSRQSEPPKSASSSRSTLPNNVAVGAPPSLPAAPPAVKFYNPSFPVNEAPYMTMVQNNGYSFPVSTHIANPSLLQGGINAHAMPFFNGSYYSPQMFHPSLLQHHQPHSQQHMVQPSHQSSSTPSGSSSSQMKAQNQQQARLQQPQKNHTSSQLEDTPSVANAQKAYAQNSVYSASFGPHVQQLNFSLVSSSSLPASNGPNQGEKHQQSSKARADLVPSQAYNLSNSSFNGSNTADLVPSQAYNLSNSSFNGSNTATSISFTSPGQNRPIFHVMPDISQHGYAAPQSAQLMQQNGFRSEVKSSSDSNNDDDKRKSALGKSSNGISNSLTFYKPNHTDVSASSMIKGLSTSDISVKTLSFTTATSGGMGNSRYHQPPIQPQKQQVAKFFGNSSISTQGSNLSSPSQWRNQATISVSQAPSPSLLMNTPHQARVSQGQNQISFGGQISSRSQQISIGNHPAQTLLPGSQLSKCSSSNVRTASTLAGGKNGTAVTTLQS